jgi:AraC-like DNA-binding protein
MVNDSAFAARFTQLAGEPVMRYVTRWRMYVALAWLKEGDLALAEIASRSATSQRRRSAGPSSAS